VHSAIIHGTVRCATGLSDELASNGYPAPTVDCKSTCHGEQCAAEVRAAKSEGTALSSVALDCPVPQEDKAPTIDSAPNPNGWVTWRHTGQGTMPVRCAHRQQPPQRLWKWLGAINIPNHLIHINPSIPNISFNTRAKDSTPRHIK
jgi:hypothetical protein